MFALSIDDFVTSYFVSGHELTFPIWVYGAVKVGLPPQVFVMGTFIFVFGLILAATSLLSSQRRARAAKRPTARADQGADLDANEGEAVATMGIRGA